LRLNQEPVHDFILLFMPPCGPHLTPLATGSLEPSLLVFSTPGGLTGDDLLRLFFTCTNTSQAATCTCNTQPRISPHNIVNHSSHQEATIDRSSSHTWSLDFSLVNIMQWFSTQDKELKAFMTLKQIFSSIGISHTKFMIYKLNMVHEVPLQQKEA
jgi:hypothetical protein